MASDLFIVNLLTQKTESGGSKIKWRRRDGNGQYLATLNDNEEFIELKLGHVASMSGSRLFLEISTEGWGGIHVEEPIMSASIFRRYDSKEEKEFAAAMKKLFAAVVRQQNNRDERDMINIEERKQEIYKRLMRLEL